MDSSPLATLPPEIRTKIHEFVLAQPKPLTFHRPAPNTFFPRLQLINHPKHLLALTQTCRAIRRETRLLFYSVNVLFIRDLSFGARECNLFMRTLSQLPDTIGLDATRALRRIYIVFAPLQCQNEGWHRVQPFQRGGHGCPVCTVHEQRLAEVREWLLARPEARVTVVMGWWGRPEVTTVDVRDLEAPWTVETDSSGDPDLVAIMDDVRRPEDTQSAEASTSLEQHCERLERFRVGVKCQAEIRQMGVLGRAVDSHPQDDCKYHSGFLDSDGNVTW